MKTQGIYTIVNIHTAEAYVGSSVDVQRRWADHKRELRQGSHKNSQFQEAWQHWGSASFQLKIVEMVKERDDLEVREQHHIPLLHPSYNESRTATRSPYRTWRSDAADEVRFWNKVDCVEEGCWLWNGALFSQGYGCFKIAGKMHKAHRVAHRLIHGVIPDGFVVCPRCDNPKCVRPDHLFAGTHEDNTADMISKGRGYVNRPDCLLGKLRVPLERNVRHLHPERMRGELNPRAVLTREQVDVIRKRYEQKELSQSALAREYGVAQTAISAIVKKVNWQD